MTLTVAWVHPYSGYHNNWIFEPGRDRDLATYKWQYLRDYLAERQIDLQTFDVLDRQGRQADVYLFDNLYPFSLRYILRRVWAPGPDHRPPAHHWPELGQEAVEIPRAPVLGTLHEVAEVANGG